MFMFYSMNVKLQEPELILSLDMLENTITGLGYLEMMYDDHEIFGTRAVPNINNPYLHDLEHPAKRRISWLVSLLFFFIFFGVYSSEFSVN